VSTEPKIPVENGTDVPADRPGSDHGNGVSSPSPAEFERQRRRSLQQWPHRISIFLFVLVSAVAGVLLVILPWTPQWTDNYFLAMFPSLRTFISNGFVRGLCSGLGLLDIWIGFWEAIHYQEKS
jgi:hypothetical protein